MQDPSPARHETPLLAVKDLKTHYPLRRRHLFAKQTFFRAVDGVSFDIERGGTLGLVGESGSGKSTTGMSVLRLTQPTGGEVWFNGRSVTKASKSEMQQLRRDMQVVLQSPHASLNQRMTISSIISEPLLLHRIGSRKERQERVRELLDVVGLRADQAERYPHEFSGGQRQRIAIARALALNPQLIVADEPVSALDVSIQAQIINLLGELQASYGLTFLFISHDLSVVKHFASRVAVMYAGRIVEIGDKHEIYAAPRHPYTQALLSAVPRPVPGARRPRMRLAGDATDASGGAAGCSFYSRCPMRLQQCRESAPALRPVATDHQLACHLDT